MALDTPDYRSSHFAGYERILRIVLECPSAKRITMDVHTWGKPDRNTEKLHLSTHGKTHPLKKVYIKRLGKKLAAWPCSGKLVMHYSIFRLGHPAEHGNTVETEKVSLVGFHVLLGSRTSYRSVRKPNDPRREIQSCRTI